MIWKMSQNKKMIEDIIEYIETIVHQGFKEADFIKNFRDKIEKYIKERLS